MTAYEIAAHHQRIPMADCHRGYDKSTHGHTDDGQVVEANHFDCNPSASRSVTTKNAWLLLFQIRYKKTLRSHMSV